MSHKNDQAAAQVSSICDMVAALEVDYDRLAELKAAAAAWVAGHNVAGYLPDGDAGEFESWSDAQTAITNELEDYAIGSEDNGDAVNSADFYQAAAVLQDVEEGTPFTIAAGPYEFWIKPAVVDADDLQELEELESAANGCEDGDAAYDAVKMDPLSVEFRSGWTLPGRDMEAGEYRILLCTGGPHVELQGKLNGNGEPDSVEVYCSDWFEGLQVYPVNSSERDALLTYACIILGV